MCTVIKKMYNVKKYVTKNYHVVISVIRNVMQENVFNFNYKMDVDRNV
jgi:hypothetical protein